MKKEIFIAVCDYLKEEVPELKWIDAEDGQLSTNERPPVAFPCCLIDMAYSACNTLTGAKQQVTVQLQLRVAFMSDGSTNTAAPLMVREHALKRMDILEKIHRALQWWTNGRMFMPMRRIRVTSERRADGIKVYNMLYQMEFLDVVG